MTIDASACVFRAVRIGGSSSKDEKRSHSA